MSIEIAIFLAIASGFAGFVDAMAGGGGINSITCTNHWAYLIKILL